MIGRFAPSPSGRMHLGNLWSCLLAWLAARSAEGGMVLRLEDLDPDRCRQEYCDQIMRDLEWLGLDWDGVPVYQSRRTELYRQAFHTLEQQDVIYPCFCTRAERLAASAPHRSDGVTVYSGRCRALTQMEREELLQSRRPAWRAQVPEQEVAFTDMLQGVFSENLARDCGDFILRRSDGVFAYQLAVVVDDGEMGVTQVVRGERLALLYPAADVASGEIGPSTPGVWPSVPAAGSRRPAAGQTGPGPGVGTASREIHRTGDRGSTGLYRKPD